MEPILAGRDLRKYFDPTLVPERGDFLTHAGDKLPLVGPTASAGPADELIRSSGARRTGGATRTAGGGRPP